MSAPERTRPLDGAVNPNAETASQQGPVADDEAGRQERIAVAAYYKAERRGFKAGGEQEDWLEAEKEVDRQGARQARPSRLESDVGSPDHMVAREPLPSGQPHDPVPAREKSSRKPERRTRAR